MSFNFSNSSGSSVTLLTICFKSRTDILISISYVITYILLLFPLFFLVIYLALWQWRKQHTRSSAATMNHSDFFTYNVIGLELISILCSCLYCFGAYAESQTLQLVAVSICSITSPGQVLFHVLTCVERYVAVVHPITYLSLKQAGGVRIRNISTVCVWLVFVGLLGFPGLFSSSFYFISVSCLLVFSLILVSFCSFSILYVLKHPGPGEVSKDREQVDQSKQRAFKTIVAIMVAQLFKFVGNLISNIMFTSPALTITECAVGSTTVWLSLPCSLVLPLLFLQRAGKLPSCKRNTNITATYFKEYA